VPYLLREDLRLTDAISEQAKFLHQHRFTHGYLSKKAEGTNKNQDWHIEKIDVQERFQIDN